MADVTNIVDPDNGTGTDYTSLNAWEAQNIDLVTAGDTETAECRSSSGSADTTAVTFAGWIDGVSNKVTIQSTGSNRHSGIWNTNKYRLTRSDGTICLTLSDSGVTHYLNVDGLQFNQSGGGGNDCGIAVRYGTWNIDVTDCIFKGPDSGAGSYADGIQAYLNSGGTANIYNCVFYDWNSSSNSGGVAWYGGTVIVYNCTFYNCYNGAREYGGAMTVKNCVDIGGTAGFGSPTTTDYNISDISGDAVGTNGSITTQTDAQLFNDATADDFSVADSSSDLYNAGTDLSGTFTTDIAGTTRSTWDIGAFEYVSGGATYNESLTLSANASISGSGGLVLDESVTWSASAGISEGAQADLVGSLNLSASAVMAQSVIGDLLASLGLSVSADIAMATAMVMGSSLALDAAAGMSQEGTIGAQTYEESLTLAVNAGMDPAGALVFAVSMALSASAGINQTAGLLLEALTTLSAIAGQTQNVTQDHQATVELQASMTQAQSAIWDGSVSLALSAIADMIQSGFAGDAVIFAHQVVMQLTRSKHRMDLTSSDKTLKLTRSKHDLEE